MKQSILIIFAALLLSGCDNGGALDFGVQFGGTLSRRAVSTDLHGNAVPAVGTICILTQCTDTDEEGVFNFEVFDATLGDGGTVAVSTVVDGMMSEATLLIPEPSQVVHIELSVDAFGGALEIESVVTGG